MLPDPAAQKFVEEVDEILARLEQRKCAPAVQERAQQIKEHEEEITRLRGEIQKQLQASIAKTEEELRKALDKHKHHSDHAAAMTEATNRLAGVIRINGTIPARLVENYLNNYFKELKRKEEDTRKGNGRRLIIF